MTDKTQQRLNDAMRNDNPWSIWTLDGIIYIKYCL